MRCKAFKNLLLLAFLAFALVSCSQFFDEHGNSIMNLDAEIQTVSSSSSAVLGTEVPVMDSRVVSYQRAHWSGYLGFRGIIADPDTLKSWFPNKLNNDECNYFAIFNSTNSSSSGYLVLAQDMVLYSLTYSSGEGCAETTDIFYDVMLVCDDAANTFRNNINLNGSYAVPGWDCSKWQTAPEKGYF